MLIAIVYFLIYLLVAVIIIEILFYILALIFPTGIITQRVRGLAYALILLVGLLYFLNHFNVLHI